MKKEVNTSFISIIGSLIFLAIALASFYWLWSKAQPGDVTDVTVDQKYKPVEISSIKEQARQLIESKDNAGNLPLTVPSSSDTGKKNPFSGS